MEDVDVPVPNPFITAFLVGPLCRAMVFESADLYQALYRGIVAKRTGELALSAHVSTGIEGDRWVGVMTAGNPVAYYAASHEFGVDDGDMRIMAGAYDMNKILNLMGTL